MSSLLYGCSSLPLPLSGVHWRLDLLCFFPLPNQVNTKVIECHEVLTNRIAESQACKTVLESMNQSQVCVRAGSKHSCP